LLYTRAYNAASTAGNPAAIAIQIGKGLKGRSVNAYGNIGKTIPESIDLVQQTTNVEFGVNLNVYDETTGILYIDVGRPLLTTNTVKYLNDINTNNNTNGYFVINASKNPALTGIGLNRIAARAVQSSGQTIGTSNTTIVWDATKSYDTHGMINTTTGIITAPESGYYKIESSILFNSATFTTTQFVDIGITKNSTTVISSRTYGNGANTLLSVQVSDTVYLNKNDTISIFSQASVARALFAGATWNIVTISKVSV
jgi:hypothetical protein